MTRINRAKETYVNKFKSFDSIFIETKNIKFYTDICLKFQSMWWDSFCTIKCGRTDDIEYDDSQSH